MSARGDSNNRRQLTEPCKAGCGRLHQIVCHHEFRSVARARADGRKCAVYGSGLRRCRAGDGTACSLSLHGGKGERRLPGYAAPKHDRRTHVLRPPISGAAVPSIRRVWLDRLRVVRRLDIALRDAFIAAPTRRYSTYWAVRSPPEGLTSDTIASRKALTVPIVAADVFFTQLAERVEALASVHAPHPLSSEIAVAMLKRAIQGSDRPRIDDLVGGEAERVARFIAGQDLMVSFTPEEMVRRVEQYQSHCTCLLSLLAHGIFYSQSADYRSWLKTVQSVINAGPRTHSTVLNGRPYSAIRGCWLFT